MMNPNDWRETSESDMKDDGFTEISVRIMLQSIIYYKNMTNVIGQALLVLLIFLDKYYVRYTKIHYLLLSA